MESSAPLHDRQVLETLFDELGRELEALGTTAEIVMVGGCWLLWHGGRSATHDVDSARRLDAQLATAVRRVASRHDLEDRWVNDSAAMFWPANVEFGDCAIAHVNGGLTVKTPPARVIFVMKLYRANAQDYEDMISLWPQCDFHDPTEAATAFRSAYPHAPDDEFLVSYIEDIATDAGTV